MSDHQSQDEIYDSQPISLPSSNNSDIEQVTSLELKRPPKFTGQKQNFRSVEEIDPKYRHVFTYPYFNFVQSHVIEDALYSDKSMVVCAPTGSGKTVIFEMAIVQLLMELEDKKYSGDFKIIYMAPVKALCTERLTEWYPKFNKLGHLCIEVTGDTDVEFPQLKPYRIIITTPEKWDMLTRRWKDHKSLVEVVKLFLIDEVHILNDEIRGPVLEAVVSRMKTIETSVQCTNRIEKLLAQYKETSTPNTSAMEELNANPIRIRFVAVSATVSNPQDVAEWLGTTNKPAVYHKFGDECRPVKLKRVVEGYPCPAGTSIFKFDIVLNYKLWNIIQKYHNGKPTLIFCNTRKSVLLTAEALSREITVSFNMEQKNKLTALASTIKNKKIQSLILCGVGCHHAGLLFEERMNIELAFRNRDLPILITTTTLAMGVNLPAHLVIIKNTQQYVNGGYQEYSISTILQMVGRAGRPQYDTEATAVIMTRIQDKARYQSLVEGSEPLQSYLHKRLAENLNSETALGTVCDVAQCVQWLNSTFLSVRAARDPRRYLGVPHGAPPQQISKKIEDLCVKAMNKLASAGLISMDEACCITSTEAGRLMSIYYLDLETMKLIMKLDGSESLERLLWLICESHELSDMHLRVDERRCLNSLNRNTAAATIRFPMKGKINSRQMKLSCVIQAVLGSLPIPEPSLNQEALKIMRIADRVCKCLVYYVTRPNFISQNPKFYITILNSLILAKCIYARLWENSPYVSRQLKGIGQIFSTLLASAGKVNFMLLEESHPRDLERIMNKGPPAGNVIRRQVSLLPKYNLTATPIDGKTVKIHLSLLNHAHLSENVEQLTAGASHKSYVIVGDSENYLVYLTSFKDSDLINVYDGCMTFEVTRKHNSKHELHIHCISSTFVGIDEQYKYVFNDINPIATTNKPAAMNLPDKVPINMHDDEADVFKDRKRKAKETDKSQCNEKKKRDMNLVEKFNQLKESFGRTTRNIKIDHHETKEMSNKILSTLAPQQDRTNIDKEYDNLKGNSLDQNIEDAFAEDFNDEDFVDDRQVSDILNGIENEIKSKNEMPLNNKPIPYICPKNSFDEKKSVNINAKRKTLTTKNNYKFIDLLDKEDNNDDANTDICQETGFTNSVKGQIEQYLQKAYNYNNNKMDIIDLIEPTKSNDKIKNHETNNDDDINESMDLTKTQISSLNNDEIIVEVSNCKKAEDGTVDCGEELKNDTDVSQLRVFKPDNECNFTGDENKKVIGEISMTLSKNADNIITSNKHLELYSNDLNRRDNIQMDKSTTENILTLTSSPLNLQNIGSNKLSNPNRNIVPSIEQLNNCTNILSSDTHKTYMGNKQTNIDNTSISGENLEYIKNYRASQTKLINLTSENSKKQKIQIIGKLKVDLDVTEIVHKSDTRNINNYSDIIECNDIENLNDPNINKSYNFGDTIKAIAYKTHTENNKNKQNEADEIEVKDVDVIKDNVPLKKLLNDTEYSNNLKSNMNSSLQNEKKDIESISVKDILQKYNNNVQRQMKEEINVNTEINKKKEEKVGETKTTKAIGHKRQLRIRDIDNIDIELPPLLIGESQKTTNSKYTDYKNRELQKQFKENNSDIEEIQYEMQPEIVSRNIPTVDIEDLNPELEYPDLTIELTDYNTDFDVNSAMLNPQALLQTINKEDKCNSEDDDEIIPPPPQFCDEDTYSPINTSPENKLTDIIEYGDFNTQNIDETDTNEDDYIFDENNEFDLTPSKEVETWSPSHENSSIYSTEGQSFTVMRRNVTETNNRHHFFNSRREKLSQFKFKRKSIFRK